METISTINTENTEQQITGDSRIDSQGEHGLGVANKPPGDSDTKNNYIPRGYGGDLASCHNTDEFPVEIFNNKKVPGG